MNKRFVTCLVIGLAIALAVITYNSGAGKPYKAYWFQIQDEYGNAVTDFTSATVYEVDGTSAATVYASDQGGSLTNPILVATTSNGEVKWYGNSAAYDVKIITSTQEVKVNDLDVNRHRVVLNRESLPITLKGMTLDNTTNLISTLVFEGATADAYEATFSVTDPTTSDKVYTFPDATGEVSLLGQTIESAEITANTVAMADLVRGTNGQIIVANTGDDSAYVTMGTDATLSATGVLTIAAGAVTQTKLDTTIIRMSLSYFQDGKTTVSVLAANEHPKMRLKSAYAQLIEVPDAGATTYTVKVYNSTDTADMSDTLTFTQGTEAVADVKAFVPDATNHTADKADVIQIITAGTTATAGEVVVTLEFLGVD